VKVLCVAADEGTLAALRRASVAAEWELTPGATGELDALASIDRDRPHAVVVFGGFERLVALTRERFPAIRIVTDRGMPGTDAVASSPEEVRGVLRTLASPRGPVRS
jgi:hypothetical protein